MADQGCEGKSSLLTKSMKTNSKNHELKLIKLQNQTLMKTLDYQLELIELKKAEIEDLKLQKRKIKLWYGMIFLLGLFLSYVLNSSCWSKEEVLDTGFNHNQTLKDQLTICKVLNETAKVWQKENADYEFMLLAFGSDINARNQDQETPLHVATQTGKSYVVESLLGYEPDVDLVNKHGETALHLATRMGNIDIIEALLYKGADIDVQNLNQDTPLHIAVENGNLEAVRWLLYFEANISLKNIHDQTPMDIANFKQLKEIIHLLEMDYEELRDTVESPDDFPDEFATLI